MATEPTPDLRTAAQAVIKSAWPRGTHLPGHVVDDAALDALRAALAATPSESAPATAKGVSRDH